MRRWAVALVGAVAFAGLTGCAQPDGVDGDLTNGWRPMPPATAFRPDSGTCHAEFTQQATVDKYDPVPCTGPHLAETVAVADLSAEDQAFQECSRQATSFLGADWRTGWVVLQPVLPTRKAWAGGAHWVRCDVAEMSPAGGTLVRRSSSMRGAVRSGGALRKSCVNPTISGDKVTGMRPVACASAHTAEFAGLFETTRATAADLSSTDLARGCEGAIARFAGLAQDGNLASRIGWLGFPPDETSWTMGDRAVRCFLWLNGQRMKGSYRNAGPGKLPIHYAKE